MLSKKQVYSISLLVAILNLKQCARKQAKKTKVIIFSSFYL